LGDVLAGGGDFDFVVGGDVLDDEGESGVIELWVGPIAEGDTEFWFFDAEKIAEFVADPVAWSEGDGAKIPKILIGVRPFDTMTTSSLRDLFYLLSNA